MPKASVKYETLKSLLQVKQGFWSFLGPSVHSTRPGSPPSNALLAREREAATRAGRAERRCISAHRHIRTDRRVVPAGVPALCAAAASAGQASCALRETNQRESEPRPPGASARSAWSANFRRKLRPVLAQALSSSLSLSFFGGNERPKVSWDDSCR